MENKQITNEITVENIKDQFHTFEFEVSDSLSAEQASFVAYTFVRFKDAFNKFCDQYEQLKKLATTSNNVDHIPEWEGYTINGVSIVVDKTEVSSELRQKLAEARDASTTEIVTLMQSVHTLQQKLQAMLEDEAARQEERDKEIQKQLVANISKLVDIAFEGK